MLILGLETSAKAVSVALLRDGILLGEYFQNSGQTHSRTLMKILEDLLKNTDYTPEDVDLVAYANGPGSFTGIRIGVSAAKGLCWGRELPCVPVSTLEAMAYTWAREGVVCACMDARRQQIYNGLFQIESGIVHRLTEDRAISLENLGEELKKMKKPIFLVGDGAVLCYNTLKHVLPELCLAPEHLRQQRASGVALAAWRSVQERNFSDPKTSVPNYLRLSQAERERLAKEMK